MPPVRRRRTLPNTQRPPRPDSTLDTTHAADMSPIRNRSSNTQHSDQLRRTGEYKVLPLKRAARELLGYPYPRRVPRGMYIEQAIGISTDEFTRAKDSGVRYLRNVFPLIDLGWDHAHCVDYLAERGFEKTVRSACVGCPVLRLVWPARCPVVSR